MCVGVCGCGCGCECGCVWVGVCGCVRGCVHTCVCVCVESLEFSEMGGLPKLGGGSGVIFEMGFFLNTLQ